jgi:hypothetical protein
LSENNSTFSALTVADIKAKTLDAGFMMTPPDMKGGNTIFGY